MARMPEPPLVLKLNRPSRPLLLLTLGLLVLGVVMVHSAVASVDEPARWHARKDVRHTIFAGMALLILCTVRMLNYRVLLWRIPPFGSPGTRLRTCTAFLHDRVPFFPAVALLVSVIFGFMVFVPGVGREVGGFHRWIRIGAPEYRIGFQPSELIKISLLVFLGTWLSLESTDVRSFKGTFLPAAVIIGVCLVLVGTQDLGTGLIIAVTAGLTLLLAGVPWYFLGSLLGVAAGGFSTLLLLSPHRLARITAMLEPWSLSNPCSYQPRQSLLAILTGGMTGKGLGRGMIKQGFLPEGETDFIFSVFFEECGFIGALLLLCLLLLWIWFARKAAVRAPDGSGRLLAGSLGFAIALQAVLHVAVDVVAAPPTGMNLPFVSAGGTALIASAVGVALMLSVTARSGSETTRARGLAFVHPA